MPVWLLCVRLGHGDFKALSRHGLLRHFGLLWAIWRSSILVPEDLKDTESSLPSNGGLLWCHTALLIAFVGLKFGPWRSALVAAALEHGLAGNGDGPCLTWRLLRTILRVTCCRMHQVAIGAWSSNTGRASMHHTGGILWMKHLGIVERDPQASGRSLVVGAVGAQWRLLPETPRQHEMLKSVIWAGEQLHPLVHRLPWAQCFSLSRWGPPLPLRRFSCLACCL